MNEVENYGGMYMSLDNIIANLGGTDDEDEDFLSNVPLDVLTQSIDKQFDDPEEFINNDFVQAFINNIEYERSHYHTEDEDMDIEERREKFILYMVKSFESRLGLGFNDIDSKPEEEQNDIIQYVYRFFLMDIRKNFVNLIMNYIDENSEAIYDKYKDLSNASQAVFKNEITDEVDITVLANLSPIIDYILDDVSFNMDDCLKFFTLCEGKSANINLESTRDYFNDFIICGNFIKNYINLVDDDLADTIKSKVRNKILKKYPKRKNLNPVEEDNNIDETMDDAE